MGTGFGKPPPAYPCHIQRVTLDRGGYDASGAYWGIREAGSNLYCCFNCDLPNASAGRSWQKYIDAPNRKTAVAVFVGLWGVVPTLGARKGKGKGAS